MLIEVTLQECIPLLRKLWPKLERVYPIDNTGGLIEYTGENYSRIEAKYFLWKNTEGVPVGTSHGYTTGPGKLRIRGTWVDERYRKNGIGKAMIEGLMARFSGIDLVYTFPREGTEDFYRTLGFSFPQKLRHSSSAEYGYSYAEKKLSSRTSRA